MSAVDVLAVPARGFGSLHIARKAGKCANARAAAAGNATGCLLTIEVGAQYMEGDYDPCVAGGFGKERICFACYERDHSPTALARCKGGVK